MFATVARVGSRRGAGPDSFNLLSPLLGGKLDDPLRLPTVMQSYAGGIFAVLAQGRAS